MNIKKSLSGKAYLVNDKFLFDMNAITDWINNDFDASNPGKFQGFEDLKLPPDGIMVEVDEDWGNLPHDPWNYTSETYILKIGNKIGLYTTGNSIFDPFPILIATCSEFGWEEE